MRHEGDEIFSGFCVLAIRFNDLGIFENCDSGGGGVSGGNERRVVSELPSADAGRRDQYNAYQGHEE